MVRISGQVLLYEIRMWILRCEVWMHCLNGWRKVGVSEGCKLQTGDRIEAVEGMLIQNDFHLQMVG
jgi:hypothetical protein